MTDPLAVRLDELGYTDVGDSFEDMKTRAKAQNYTYPYLYDGEAQEIAATHGVDVVLMGNNDLVSFSGWQQNDPRYQDALIKVHDAAPVSSRRSTVGPKSAASSPKSARWPRSSRTRSWGWRSRPTTT